METVIVLWIKWRGMVEIKHRLYRCNFNHALSKLIADNRLEDIWRRENPDIPEFTRYNRLKIVRVCTDIKIASSTQINHIMVSFSEDYNAIFIDRFASKTKIRKDSSYFSNSLLFKPEFSSTAKIFSFFIKNIKQPLFGELLVGKC